MIVFTLFESIRKIPFVRFFIPFLLGIILQIKLNFQPIFILYTVAISFILIFAFLLIKNIGSSYKRSWIFGLLVNIFLCFSGIVITQYQQTKILNVDTTNINGVIIANIVEPVSEKPNSIKSVVEVFAIKNNDDWLETSGKAIIYFEKDSISKNLEIGDRIAFEPNLNDIQSTNNPHEFNYKKYLFFHLISKQAYLKSDSWTLIKSDKGNFIQYYADKIRNRLISIYEENGITGDELSIASALTLGYKDKLNEEIKRSYSSAGAMHVLAVSGLHVGIIYLIFSSLLFFLDKNKYSRIFKTILLLLVLWFYAYITGLSPSVLRASTMFSFIIVAKTFNRKTNIYNTLAASAFLLVLINPYIIMEVGFQLSYLAVLAIVFFQPKMYKWISFKYKLFDKAWALFTVSIAAQLGTAPIAIYYFHQFPNYFFITNFIVIPAATLILCLGMAVLVTSFIPAISSFIAYILSLIIKGLNFSMNYIEQLPYSTTNDISINMPETLILYAIFLLIAFYFLYKRVRILQFALVSIVLFFAINIYNNLDSIKQRQFIVYNIRGNTAFNFIDGNDNILYSDIVVKENPSQLMYSVKNNWLKLGLDNEKIIDLNRSNKQFLFTNLFVSDNQRVFNKNSFYKFYDKSILFIDNDKYLNKKSEKKLDIDFIVLSKNVKVKIEDIVKLFDFKLLIIDSSNSNWIVDNWIDECETHNVDYMNVLQDGAFVYEF